MASPLARGPKPGFFPDNFINNSSKEATAEDGAQKNSGFKQSRPMNLAIARSPLFTVPQVKPFGFLVVRFIDVFEDDDEDDENPTGRRKRVGKIRL
ncbi:hypothetical protein K1719_001013 [Acacia pycnantha]|nr:hypothetical protein K1719_001013 [Acacia pycnantha]